MKKCPGCERAIDKYAIACEYCGRVGKETQKDVTGIKPERRSPGNRARKDTGRK